MSSNFEYAERVWTRETGSNDKGHKFPVLFDDMIVEHGVVGKDVANPRNESGRYVEYHHPGSINNTNGRFEIGFDGNTVTHRAFRAGGSAGGNDPSHSGGGGGEGGNGSGGGGSERGGGDNGGGGGDTGGKATSNLAANTSCKVSTASSGVFESLLESTGLLKSYLSSCGNRSMGGNREFGRGPGGVQVPRGRLAALTSAPELSINDTRIDVATLIDSLQDWDQLPLGLARDELVHRITRELTSAIFFEDAFPFFSLHFRTNGTLYPVLNPHYHGTVVGHVIATLDYFLKGFLNGGVYTVDFLSRWSSPDSVDRQMSSPQERELLSNNIQDMRRLVPDGVEYISLREALASANLNHLVHGDLESDANEPATTSNSLSQNTSSAPMRTSFRIIGTLDTVERAGSLVFTHPSFRVEYTVEPSPAFQQRLDDYFARHGRYPADFNRINEVYAHATQQVTQVMPQIPIFRPYFAALKLITSLSAIITSMRASGIMPSLTALSPLCSRVPLTPREYPPLPVRFFERISATVTIGDVINTIRAQQPPPSGSTNRFAAAHYPALRRTTSPQQALPSPFDDFLRNTIVNGTTLPATATAQVGRAVQTILGRNPRVTESMLADISVEPFKQTFAMSAQMVLAQFSSSAIMGALETLTKSFLQSTDSRVVRGTLTSDRVVVSNDAIEGLIGELRQRIEACESFLARCDLLEQALPTILQENFRLYHRHHIANFVQQKRQKLIQDSRTVLDDAERQMLQQVNELPYHVQDRARAEMTSLMNQNRTNVQGQVDSNLRQLDSVLTELDGVAQKLTSENVARLRALYRIPSMMIFLTDLADLDLARGSVRFSRMDVYDTTFLRDQGDDVKIVGGCGITLEDLPDAPLASVCAQADAERVARTLSSLAPRRDGGVLVTTDEALKAIVLSLTTVSGSPSCVIDAACMMSASKNVSQGTTLEDALPATVMVSMRAVPQSEYTELNPELLITSLRVPNNPTVTPLHVAAGNLSPAAVKVILSTRDGVSWVNAACAAGTTPLACAAAAGTLQQDADASAVLKLLLESGANANVVLRNGLTPLYIAAQKGSAARCRILLKHNADPSVAPDSGMTPLHCAIANGLASTITRMMRQARSTQVLLGLQRREDGATPLLLAAMRCDATCLFALVTSCREAVSALSSQRMQMDHRKALHLIVDAAGGKSVAPAASIFACVELVMMYAPRQILERDREQRTPLVLALRNGLAHATDLMLQGQIEKPVVVVPNPTVVTRLPPPPAAVAAALARAPVPSTRFVARPTPPPPAPKTSFFARIFGNLFGGSKELEHSPPPTQRQFPSTLPQSTPAQPVGVPTPRGQPVPTRAWQQPTAPRPAPGQSVRQAAVPSVSMWTPPHSVMFETVMSAVKLGFELPRAEAQIFRGEASAQREAELVQFCKERLRAGLPLPSYDSETERRALRAFEGDSLRQTCEDVASARDSVTVARLVQADDLQAQSGRHGSRTGFQLHLRARSSVNEPVLSNRRRARLAAQVDDVPLLMSVLEAVVTDAHKTLKLACLAIRSSSLNCATTLMNRLNQYTASDASRSASIEALALAAIESRDPAMWDAIVHRLGDANAITVASHGGSLMHEVARRGLTDFVQGIAESGIDLHRVDREGKSALDVAACAGAHLLLAQLWEVRRRDARFTNGNAAMLWNAMRCAAELGMGGMVTMLCALAAKQDEQMRLSLATTATALQSVTLCLAQLGNADGLRLVAELIPSWVPSAQHFDSLLESDRVDVMGVLLSVHVARGGPLSEREEIPAKAVDAGAFGCAALLARSQNQPRVLERVVLVQMMTDGFVTALEEGLPVPTLKRLLAQMPHGGRLEKFGQERKPLLNLLLERANTTGMVPVELLSADYDLTREAVDKVPALFQLLEYEKTLVETVVNALVTQCGRGQRGRQMVAQALLQCAAGGTVFDLVRIGLRTNAEALLFLIGFVVRANRRVEQGGEGPLRSQGRGERVGGTTAHIFCGTLGLTAFRAFLDNLRDCDDTTTQQLFKAVDAQGRTPLMCLAKADKSSPSALDDLLVLLNEKTGGKGLEMLDVAAVDRSGNTALHYAVQAKNEPLVSRLLETMPRSQRRRCLVTRSQAGVTPWMMAVTKGMVSAMRLLMPSNEADRERVDQMGFTPLMRAAQEGREDICEFLLDEAGANVHATSKGCPLADALEIVTVERGGTAMHVAARAGGWHVMRTLMAHGADPLVRDALGATALVGLVRSGRADAFERIVDGVRVLQSTGETALEGELMIAAAVANEPRLVFACASRGISAMSFTHGSLSTLHVAAQRGSNLAASALVAVLGTDEAVQQALMFKDERGLTPLHVCAKYGAVGVARVLLAACANQEMRRELLEAKGGPHFLARTALHLAVDAGEAGVAALLVQAGADVRAADARGDLPQAGPGREGIRIALSTRRPDNMSRSRQAGTLVRLSRQLSRRVCARHLPSSRRSQEQVPISPSPPPTQGLVAFHIWLSCTGQYSTRRQRHEFEALMKRGRAAEVLTVPRGRAHTLFPKVLQHLKIAYATHGAAGLCHVANSLEKVETADDLRGVCVLLPRVRQINESALCAAAAFAFEERVRRTVPLCILERICASIRVKEPSHDIATAFGLLCARLMVEAGARALLMLCRKTQVNATLRKLIVVGQALLDLARTVGSAEALDLKHIYNETIAQGNATTLPSDGLLSIEAFLEVISTERTIAEQNRYPDNSVEQVMTSFASCEFPLSNEELAHVAAIFEQMSAVERNGALTHLTDAELGQSSESLGTRLHQCCNGLPHSREEWALAAQLLAHLRLATQRVFRLRPRVTQMFAIIALLSEDGTRKGRLAQILTGEGKSLTLAVLIGYLARCGRTVDVVTSNEYLAERDAESFAPLYDMMGLTCGHVCAPVPLSAAFVPHVCYGTNTAFEFAVLRRILGWPGGGVRPDGLARQSDVVVVDEVDNLFIDTASSPARLACAARHNYSWVYTPILAAVQHSTGSDAETVTMAVAALQAANAELARTLPMEAVVRWVMAAKASLGRQRDVDYVITNGSVELVDFENTGQRQTGSRWSDGIHEFVEVREGIEPQAQALTLASLAHPSFFSMYRNIFGVSGTMGDGEERDEVHGVYNTSTFDVPPHRERRLVEMEARAWPETIGSQLFEEELAEHVLEMARTRPILVLCLTIEGSERIAQVLRGAGATVQLLNKMQAQSEELVVMRAGEPGRVTVATNAAGRGTDIRLSREAIDAGGLHVVITFLPANERVHRQGIGRAGRQNQPGTAILMLPTASDPLVRRLLPPGASLQQHLCTVLTALRHAYVSQLSRQRRRLATLEQIRFRILSDFFDVRLPRFLAIQNASGAVQLQLLRDRLQAEWAEFFTELCRVDTDERARSAYRSWIGTIFGVEEGVGTSTVA